MLRKTFAVALLISGLTLIACGPLIFNEVIAPAMPEAWTHQRDDGTWSARWDVEIPLGIAWMLGGGMLVMGGVVFMTTERKKTVTGA